MPQRHRLPSPYPNRESIGPHFDPAEVRVDLVRTARQRFGEALTDRVLAAENYLLAKHYVGLPPPPIVQPDGTYKYPDPPFAMLIRERGRWLAATPDGLRPANPAKADDIEAILGNRAFWDEPPWTPPQCTDAGASLLLLKASGQPERVRHGSCGRTQLTEQLVFRALEA